MEFEMRKQNTDYTVQVQGVSSPTKMVAQAFMTQLILRTLVVGFTLAAIIVTVTARQTASYLSIVVEARYNYSSALRFQVGANSVVCAFCFLSVVLLYGLMSRHKSDPINYFQLLLHDMVMTMLLISGCAAASAVGYLSKYGQKQGSWEPLCGYVEKFCDKAMLALALSYAASFCMLVLTVTAAYKLQSQTTHRINTGEL